MRSRGGCRRIVFNRAVMGRADTPQSRFKKNKKKASRRDNLGKYFETFQSPRQPCGKCVCLCVAFDEVIKLPIRGSVLIKGGSVVAQAGRKIPLPHVRPFEPQVFPEGEGCSAKKFSLYRLGQR